MLLFQGHYNKGRDFRATGRLSDLFEVHIIELGKKLRGTEAVDDWIRLFNAEEEEDLEMISMRSARMREAVEALRTMSLSGTLRYLYEERLKAIRDRNARDEYVMDQGIALGEARGEARGIALGEARGEARGMATAVLQLLSAKGGVPEELAGRIMQEKDLDVLRRWFQAAARAGDVRQFEDMAGL